MLGIAFIHLHSTPSKSREEPLPLAGSVCGSHRTDPTELSVSLGARTRTPPGFAHRRGIANVLILAAV